MQTREGVVTWRVFVTTSSMVTHNMLPMSCQTTKAMETWLPQHGWALVMHHYSLEYLF